MVLVHLILEGPCISAFVEGVLEMEGQMETKSLPLKDSESSACGGRRETVFIRNSNTGVRFAETLV